MKMVCDVRCHAHLSRLEDMTTWAGALLTDKSQNGISNVSSPYLREQEPTLRVISMDVFRADGNHLSVEAFITNRE